MFNRYKIFNIISKINKLVEIYAKKHQLENYIIDELTPLKLTTIPPKNNEHVEIENICIKKIDFTKFINENNSNIKFDKFIKILNNFVSNTEKEILFIKTYYDDYEIIISIIEMLLFNIPRQIRKDDLIKLNMLYNKYNKMIAK